MIRKLFFNKKKNYNTCKHIYTLNFYWNWIFCYILIGTNFFFSEHKNSVYLVFIHIYFYTFFFAFRRRLSDHLDDDWRVTFIGFSFALSFSLKPTIFHILLVCVPSYSHSTSVMFGFEVVNALHRTVKRRYSVWYLALKAAASAPPPPFIHIYTNIAAATSTSTSFHIAHTHIIQYKNTEYERKLDSHLRISHSMSMCVSECLYVSDIVRKKTTHTHTHTRHHTKQLRLAHHLGRVYAKFKEKKKPLNIFRSIYKYKNGFYSFKEKRADETCVKLNMWWWYQTQCKRIKTKKKRIEKNREWRKNTPQFSDQTLCTVYMMFV